VKLFGKLSFYCIFFLAGAAHSSKSVLLQKEIAVVDGAESSQSINLNVLDGRSFDDLSKLAFEKENPYEIRWTAIQNIATNYPGQAQGVLMKASAQPEWYMKNAALIGLEQINSRSLSEVAQRLISDEALVVRSMAVSVLSKQNSSEIRKLFWSELKKKYNFKRNQSLWIRYQLLEALAVNPQKYEREKFLELINEKDKKIQSISKNVIIKIQTKAFR
jgi:hypothetical protein